MEQVPKDEAWHVLQVEGEHKNKVPFRVPREMCLVKKMGQGSYGLVCALQDSLTGRQFAVKKIHDAYTVPMDAKRMLREIRLLQALDHDNIISIRNMYLPPSPDHEDVYLVTDLMETDLHRVIHSLHPLGEDHWQYFVYQTLRGLLYLHSAQVVHRDLKPSNLLVNRNCDLRIGDLGLSRSLLVSEQYPVITDYIMTRYYRAPEVILAVSQYTEKVDLWSVGCILAEMIQRRPLFTGKCHLSHIRKIMQKRGTPSQEDMAWLPKDGKAHKFILVSCEHSEGTPLKELFPKSSELCLEFLDKLLAFDPAKRPSAHECLRNPFVKHLHFPHDEPVAKFAVNWEFDNYKPTRQGVMEKVYEECLKFQSLDTIAEQEELVVRHFQDAGQGIVDRARAHVTARQEADAQRADQKPPRQEQKRPRRE